MQKLSAADLMPLEQYARERPAFRERLIAHRALRRLRIGEHCSLSFEDRLTVQYQMQEMLRAERIFEPAGIAEELETYNPLIPDGSNLKATLMIEYEDPEVRALRLVQLHGFERCCWLRVHGFDAVYGLADEDLERATESKTSAVHFLRFEFSAAQIAALRAGARLAAGVDHTQYNHQVDPVAEEFRQTVLADFA